MQILIGPAYRFVGRQLDDIEKARKAAHNQYSIAIRPRDVPDKKDGVCRGHGMTEDFPVVVALRANIARLQESEKDFKKELQNEFKTNPLASFVRSKSGLGIPTIARLLSVIGDPYVHPSRIDTATGEIEPPRPRTLSELFSYCGLTPQTKKKAGSKCSYSPQAQSALWVIADNIYSKQNPEKSELKALAIKYRDYYLTKTDAKGTPWTPAHAAAAAKRKIGRELCKMLYFEAKRIHEGKETSEYVPMILT